MARAQSSWLKQADAFTPRKLKVPTDLQDYAYGTSTGGLLTVLAVGAALLLFLFELNAFVSPMTDSSLKLDRGTGSETDLLMLELNVSVPWLSCEVASLDLSDATGFTSLNISKGIAKTPIDSNSLHFVDSSIHSSDDGSHSLSASSSQAGSSDTENTYDDGNSHAHGPYTLGSDFNDFFAGMQSTDIVLTLFYAHWCSYSQQMLPVWEAAAKQLHAKYDPNDDKRIMLASVDCSSSHDYEQLCRQLHVLAFPSVRIFRGGTDVVQSKGGKGNLHLAYVGQRTVEAITSFVEAILPRESHHVDHPDKEHKDKMHVSQRSAQIGSHVGCNLHGTIHARKVPGSVVVTARGPRSFAHGTELNLSHVVHWARFGNEPSTTFERRIVSRLHPEPSKALQPTLAGLNFTSDRPNTSFEHYLQPVHFELRPHNRPQRSVHIYESTISSHSYVVPQWSSEVPEARFQFDPSAFEVVVQEFYKSWYDFLTSVCAIIGGVLTVVSAIDRTTESIQAQLEKKLT